MYSTPCHPREIRTLRTFNSFGPTGFFTVPAGKIFVLTALGTRHPQGLSQVGLIAPTVTLYANGAVVLRGGITGYISQAALDLGEINGSMTSISKVPKGLAFPAGTVLRVGSHSAAYTTDEWDEFHGNGRAYGYLVNA